MVSSKFLRVGLWSLIGLDISLIAAYFFAIGQYESVPNWLDWNGLRSLPSLIQTAYLFTIGVFALILLIFRSRMYRPVSWMLPLTLSLLCFYGALDELIKVHLLLKQYDWQAIYLTILISIPLICRRDLIWIWKAHRSIVLWIFVGLAIFLMGGFGAESIKQVLKANASPDITLVWLNQTMSIQALAEHMRTTAEEFSELLGETFILFGVAQFVLQSINYNPVEKNAYE